MNPRMGEEGAPITAFTAWMGFSAEFDSVDQKMSAAAVDKVRGMFDMPLLLAVQKKNGYRMEGVNASYLPNGD